MKRLSRAAALVVLLPFSVALTATESTPPRQGPNGKDATLQTTQPSGYGQLDVSSVTMTFPPPADPPPPSPDENLFVGQCVPTPRSGTGTTVPYSTNYSKATHGVICDQRGVFTGAVTVPLLWFAAYTLMYNGAYLDPAVWSVSWSGCAPTSNIALCNGADLSIRNPATLGSDGRNTSATAVVTHKPSKTSFTVTFGAAMSATGSPKGGGPGGGVVL